MREKNAAGKGFERSVRGRRGPVGSICAACGAIAIRTPAKYCSVCGKRSNEDYMPLDSLRASNRLAAPNGTIAVGSESEKLFPAEENSSANIAWAFVVYSMVPYLGILFSPGALIMCGYGIFVEYGGADSDNRRMALAGSVISVAILAAQIVLWWLLYAVPELGAR